MAGLGTVINFFAIVIGGIVGLICGKFISKDYQDTITKAIGVCVLFIGIGGALEKMMTVSDTGLTSGGTMMTIVSFAIGSIIGETLKIEHHIERFGEWLKEKSGSAKDTKFVDGFVTASLTVCIGAMAIVGAIKDGIYGDYSILAAKSLLDLIMIIVMTSSLGKGCMFSAIPVAILQGGVTVAAKLIEPFMTEVALNNLSLTGSILIFCIGVNLVWNSKIKVANMLPAIVVAVIWSFIF